MKVFCQKYDDTALGEISKGRFGIFYTWRFYSKDYDKPLVKGVAFTFFRAVEKCDDCFDVYRNYGVSYWTML